MQPFNVTLPLATHYGMRAARVIVYRALVALMLLSAIGASTSSASEIYPCGGLGSVEDYMRNNEDYRSINQGVSGDYVPLLGITVGNGEGTLEDGHEFDGVEIIGVIAGGSAAAAGLKGQWPPAIIGLALFGSKHIFGSSHMGESHEFVIAVDAIRTHDVKDFGAALEQARPGEIVYLTVVRNGQREQLRVRL